MRELTQSIASLKLAGYALCISILEYLNISTEAAGLLLALMVFDLVTGMGKQYRLNPRKITSHVMVLGIMAKCAVFGSVLFFAWAMEVNNFHYDWFISLIMGVLIMGEMYSSLQNTYAIRTGKVLPEYDVVSIVLTLMLQTVKNGIEATLKKTEDKTK